MPSTRSSYKSSKAKTRTTTRGQKTKPVKRKFTR